MAINFPQYDEPLTRLQWLYPSDLITSYKTSELYIFDAPIVKKRSTNKAA